MSLKLSQNKGKPDDMVNKVRVKPDNKKNQNDK